MKLLMFFHAGSLNRGCEAIVRSAVALIKEKHPDVVVNLASFDVSSDFDIPLIDAFYDASPVPVAPFSIDGLVSAMKVKFQQDETFYHRITYKKIIALIPEHDVFLSIGGDNYCYGEQAWIYEVDRLIKKAGKKLVLWGASIGAEDLSAAKVADLRTFDLVLARETLTYDLLKSQGISQVALVADGAFTMDKELLPLPSGWQEGNTLGFNYSPLVWKRNAASKAAAYALLDHILATTSLTIVLTPHVFVPGNDDYEVLTSFYTDYKSTGRVLLLPNDLNAIQYKGYIARMRYFIGARTHATIAAYSNCVPTLVLGYSVKSKGIAKDLFGTEKLVLPLAELSDAPKLIAAFEELQRDELSLRAALKARLPAIQALAYRAVDLLGLGE